MFRYLKEDVLKGKAFSPQAFAVDSYAAVISYVEKDPSAIGVIGASRIVTLGDTLAKNILSRIKVAGISNPDSTNEIYYAPFHDELMRRQYPFLRGLYIISREEYAGLGTGFATYVASDEGQTIVERSGLVPAKQPLRIIELKNEF
jgi:phosphate transport system substrate-binding protein